LRKNNGNNLPEFNLGKEQNILPKEMPTSPWRRVIKMASAKSP
jgi:hypothetical protein